MDGVGARSRVEETTKEMVSARLASRVKTRAKAKETATILHRQGIIQESPPYPQKGESKGKGFQGECYNCGDARECPRGKERGRSKGKRDSHNGKGE